MAPLHIGHEPPAVFLLRISTESSPAQVAALATRKAAIVEALRDPQGGAGGGGADAPPPPTSVLGVVLRALATSVAGPAHGSGVGDYTAASLGVGGLLHVLYVWKPWRQYSMSKFSPVFVEHVQRKALLRAYQTVYDRLTAPGPPARYAIASFASAAGPPPPGAAPLAGGWRGAAISHVAGIHTTSALAFAAFDGSVPPDRVAAALEKLAKLLKREHERILITSPGVLG